MVLLLNREYKYLDCAFLSLLLPKENEFWQAKENNGAWETEFEKDKAHNTFFKKSNIMLTNYPNIGASEIRSWCHVPHKGIKEPFRASESYNKLSYNSAFPWMANGKNGEISMNYVFKTKTKDLSYEPGHLFKFKKYENGIYYRDLTSEKLTDVTIHLADKTIVNGILRVDKFEGKKASFSLGHYSLPHINGYIKKEIKKVNKKEVHIIDNGKYQLALVPVYGWKSVKTITSKNLHPEATQSTTINASSTYKGGKKNLYVTAMLWKKSGIPFTEKELTFGEVSCNKEEKSISILYNKNESIIFKH